MEASRLAFVSGSKMLRVPFAHLITISGLKRHHRFQGCAPRLLRLTGGFYFSVAEIALAVLLFEHTEMSNSEPNAIVSSVFLACADSTQVSMRMGRSLKGRRDSVFQIAHEKSRV